MQAGGRCVIVPPVYLLAALIKERFILDEEAMMESRFGQAFLDYKAKVRRWL